MACMMRLIFSSAFRFRARRELVGSSCNSRSGLQINHVPGIEDGRLCCVLRLLEFHPARCRRRLFVFQQKQKGRVAGGNLISMLQPLLFNAGAVHQGSIAAVKVSHQESSVLPAQQTMFSGDRGVADRDSVRRLSPDGDFSLGQRNRRVFQWSGNHQKSGIQGSHLAPFLSHFGPKFIPESKFFRYPNG